MIHFSTLTKLDGFTANLSVRLPMTPETGEDSPDSIIQVNAPFEY